MPFPANQVMNYFHVCILLLIATYLPGCRMRKSLTPRKPAPVTALACQVLSFQPRKLCLAVIKLQAEWQIPWEWCRIFPWFTHGFLRSLNNNFHQHAY